MKIIHVLVSLSVVLLGCGFLIDSAGDWDDFAVVAAIAGWAVIVTGALHLLVALERAGNDGVFWLAIASGLVLTALVVCGWTFATFASEWPEVSTVVLLVAATGLSVSRRAEK